MDYKTVGPYLFVSYASKDRNRVLPVIDELDRLGVRFWIAPNQIAAGTDYTQEIAKAISDANGVVVFLSSCAFKSGHVKKELNIALKKQKPTIPLLLEEVETPDEFLYNLEGLQHIELFREPAEHWVDEVRRALEALDIHFGVEKAEGYKSKIGLDNTIKAHAPMAAGPLVPYLVNRLQQERELREAITEHCEKKARWPLVFIVHGAVEQAIYEYIERVQKISLPRTLRRIKYADVIKWVNLSWLRITDFQEDQDRMLRHLRADIEEKLKVKPGAWPDELAQIVVNEQSTVVFCYHLRWEARTDVHLDAMYAWLLDWGRVSNLPFSCPVVVFFVIEYSKKEPSIFQLFFRKAQAEHSMRERLTRLQAIDGHNLTVRLLSELGNVTLQDIEDWILEEVKPPDPAGMIRLARTILEDPDIITEKGVPMSRLGKQLADLIERVGKEHV